MARLAAALFILIAGAAVGVGLARLLHSPLSTLVAFIFAALNVTAAVLVFRRSQRVGGRWAAGCGMYVLVLALSAWEVPGGVYLVRSSDLGSVLSIPLGAVLVLAGPLGVLSLLTSPSAFSEDNFARRG